MDVASRENGPALDGHELDRCPGANRKPNSHFDFHSDRELRDLSSDRQGFPLTPLRKIGIGLYITALSFVVIVWIQGQIDAGLKPSINWQLLAYVILTLGEAMVSITGLEFSYTQAPNSMKSSVMALWLLTVASGELFVGLVNKWILHAGGAQKVSAYQYFTFFTWLMFGAAVVFTIVRLLLQGRTYLQSQLTPMNRHRTYSSRRHTELNSNENPVARSRPCGNCMGCRWNALSSTRW
jgi:hypothetical protein